MIRTLLRPRFSVVSLLVLAACTVPSGGTPARGSGIVDGDGPSERVFGTLEYYGNPF